MKKNIAIFREKILPYSETFILNQVVSLKSFSPVLVGFWEVRHGYDIPVELLIFSKKNFTKSLEVNLLKLLKRIPGSFINRIKSHNFSLLHAHFGPDALWILPAVKKLNLPFVVTFHGYDVGFIKKPYPRSYGYYVANRKYLFERADKVIAVSHFLKNRLLELECPAEKIAVHYIGIDLEAFSPAEAERELSILSVGRLIERKGAPDLLGAMPAVQARFPDVRLLIVGSGDMEEALKARAQELNVNAEFLGVQSPESVAGLMNRASLFCLPSRDEAFGLVYAEAQAMELPVVAYANSGVNEAVVNGVTGLLSETGDLAALSDNIIKLLENPDLRARMGRAGRAHVEKNFDIRAQTRQLEAIYQEVIDVREARGRA